MKEKVKSRACDTKERENKRMETFGRGILTEDPHVRPERRWKRNV
jgi:hypothetical protein